MPKGGTIFLVDCRYKQTNKECAYRRGADEGKKVHVVRGAAQAGEAALARQSQWLHVYGARPKRGKGESTLQWLTPSRRDVHARAPCAGTSLLEALRMLACMHVRTHHTESSNP